MVNVKPDEISAILKQQLSGFHTEAELEEVGTILSVGDGIARVYGLTNAKAGELEITVADDNGKAFPKPQQLWLYKKDSKGDIVSVADGTIAINSGYRASFGGNLEEFSINQKTIYKYRFRFPKHMIDYIKGKEGNELYISVLGASSTPARVLINGGKTKVNPVKLKLIVSKII